MSSSVSDAYNHTAHTSFCFMWVFFFFIEQISCTKLILREHNDKNFVFFIFLCFIEDYPKRYYLVVMVSKEMVIMKIKDFLIKTNKQIQWKLGSVTWIKSSKNSIQKIRKHNSLNFLNEYLSQCKNLIKWDQV